MTGSETDVFHLLSLAEQRATRRVAAALDPEGCSVEQWRVLAFLGGGQGRTMSEVAEFALLPAPSATKLVDRMVSQTLVYRRADPVDRRRVLVYLSEHGTALWMRLDRIVAALADELLTAVGDADGLSGGLAEFAEALEPAARITGDGSLRRAARATAPHPARLL